MGINVLAYHRGKNIRLLFLGAIPALSVVKFIALGHVGVFVGSNIALTVTV